jgi:signal transduction histidine kinase
MMRNRRIILKMANTLILLVLIVSLLPSEKVRAYNDGLKKILILNSYHSSDPWEETIINGIQSELSKEFKNVEYEIEYMGMRKNSYETYFEKIFEFYKVKFSNTKFDLIIACDNDAFNFLNTYHGDLFNETPVAFVGVNGFKEPEIHNRRLFTGVAEEVDIKNTIDIGLKLHKKIESIYVVTDFSSAGESVKEGVQELIPFYSPRISFNFIQSTSLEDIKLKLLLVEDTSIVIAFGVFRDDNGQVLPIKEGMEEICKNTSAPVYSFWDFFLGDGIVGGVITTGERQGNLAGQISQRIMQGESPVSIPVIKEKMNSYYFDYNALKRFNIKMSALPENSIVINKPIFPYSLPKEFLWGMLIILILIFCVGTSVLLINIYWKRISEKALIKKTEHFKKRAEENRMLYTEAIQYDKVKTEFFANISHELRTPLNVLLGTIQLFDMYAKKGDIVYKVIDIDKKVNVMKQNCFRLLRLVNNLIDITKIDSGYFELQLHNKDIISIIEDITLSVADYVENKGLSLIFDTEIEEKVLSCDPDKIERIMLNLLSNAIKFTPEGGCIQVNIYNRKDYIAVCVKDSGIGIPEDKKGMIFERFRQVDKSLSRNREGSGIGLSLTKSLVEMHNGKIYVDSNLGEGSTFTFELPVKLIEDESDDVDKKIEAGHIERVSLEFSDIYS